MRATFRGEPLVRWARAAAWLLLVVATGASIRSEPADAPVLDPWASDGDPAPSSDPDEEPTEPAEAGARAEAGSKPPAYHARAAPDRAALLASPTCARVLDANERVASAIARMCECQYNPGAGDWFFPMDAGDALGNYGATCLPMREGSAWAVELLTSKPPTWTIAHYDPAGARQALAPMPIDYGESDPLGPHGVVAFDYDGDGLEEIWVENLRWCGREAAQTLYTFRAGRIAPYPLPHPARVDELDDLDGDGRPDLVSADSLELAPVRCLLSDIVCAGYTFRRLFHSRLDGTFSQDDWVARRYAQQACDDSPAGEAIVVRSTANVGAVDAQRTANRIACARLRGVPSGAIVAELQSTCPSLLGTRQARARARPCPVVDSLGNACSATEQQRVLDACPGTDLHAACMDWMFDLARETPSPILR